MPLYTMIPYLLMLAAIAFLPFLAPRFWNQSHSNKLWTALLLALPTTIWLISNGFGHEVYSIMLFDYVPFMILLTSLFIITGGIYIEGDIYGTTLVNTLLLATGAVAASIMGTTGASMLLIRPILKANKARRFKVHTVMFAIAIVANCGGLLTPLGDPPLFILYLKGAPFAWFLRLFPLWLFVNGLLLLIYYLTDKFYFSRESSETKITEESEKIAISIKGKVNFIWIAGVIAAIALINENTFPAIKQNHYLGFLREGVIALMAILSLITTGRGIRESHNFNYEPIKEVAYIFLGIFATMVPCLLYISQKSLTAGAISPSMYYYATGGLSSFLDNTPTALTFYSLAHGKTVLMQSGQLIAGIPESIMKAICAGSVLFGAMTYIGNGPNFMVKSIAESEGVSMPHFFSYVLRFSLIVLVPIYIIAEIFFIRH